MSLPKDCSSTMSLPKDLFVHHVFMERFDVFDKQLLGVRDLLANLALVGTLVQNTKNKIEI